MKHVNRIGPAVLGRRPTPPRLTMTEVVSKLGEPGTVVVDTRSDRAAFLAGHLRGSLHAPPAKFSDFGGSWLRPEEDVILVVEGPGEVDGFVRQLARIGFDRVTGAALAGELPSSGPAMVASKSVSFAGLPALMTAGRSFHVLDVRRATEFAAGHLRGAQNVAHTRLRVRLDEVPADRTLVVHCASGVRAVGAVSMLERSGRDAVCVNDAWTNCPASLR